MIKYKNQLSRQQKIARSMNLLEACICCEDEHIQETCDFILASSDKFKEKIKKTIETCPNKTPYNGLLIYEFQKNEKLNAIFELKNDTVASYLEANINDLTKAVKKNPEENPNHVSKMIKLKRALSNLSEDLRVFEDYLILHSTQIDLTEVLREFTVP